MARLTKGQSAQLSEVLMIMEFAQIAMQKGELEVCRKNLRAALKRMVPFMLANGYVEKPKLKQVVGRD